MPSGAQLLELSGRARGGVVSFQGAGGECRILAVVPIPTQALQMIGWLGRSSRQGSQGSQDGGFGGFSPLYLLTSSEQGTTDLDAQSI